jgi:precorrin-2 dehydrogenase/sirohydrochlorin ferrochelatase
VIGGGEVGARKALALLESGAHVRVISPDFTESLATAARSNYRLTLEQREYTGVEDIRDAHLIFAATSSGDLNDSIAADATSLNRLVNVVSEGAHGSFTSMAIHRAGLLTIGVSAGGVPVEAARVRDTIAEQFDDVYAERLDHLSAERLAMKEASR